MTTINLNLPDTLKIGGHECKILDDYTFDPEKEHLMGQFDPTSFDILLAHRIKTAEEGKTIKLDVATRWGTFFHELYHALEVVFLASTTGKGRFVGETLADAEERVTGMYSEAWLAVFRDNPALCKAIGKLPDTFRKENKR